MLLDQRIDFIFLLLKIFVLELVNIGGFYFEIESIIGL